MHERRIPEWLRHAPTPSVRGFSILAACEAAGRGVLISVFPLAMYGALQDVALVSEAYFIVGLLSLITGLCIPTLTRILPRRWVYSLGGLLFVMGALLASTGAPWAVVTGLALTTLSTVTTFVCFNAYVLDYIAKSNLGRFETSRMFYSALGWTLGPFAGVSLYHWHAPAPFWVAACASCTMITTFLVLRLGNGKLITKARGPIPKPWAFLPRFAAQPRLLAGWTFAVIRSCGWWVYVVYLPIYAIERGLSESLGGIVMSLTNSCLFLTPFMLRYMQKRSVKGTVRTGFAMAGILFSLAFLLADMPWIAVGCLMAGSFFLILLDVSGGLPFLLAVRPSERTEMSAIYASYRDVSGIATPGVAWLVLLAAPISGVFLATGIGLFAAWGIASHLHPRLGQSRLTLPPAAPKG